MSDFTFDDYQSGPVTGLDSFFASDQPRPSSSRVRLASLGQLSGFVRISKDTLIHKCTKDLWAIRQETDGNFYIERLFQDDGEPLKE